MTIESLFVFAGILAVAALIPGPGIIALVSRVLGNGKITGFQFLMGMALGDIVFVILAFFGMAALAETMGELFQWIKWAGAAFLAYMAYKIFTARTQIFKVSSKKAKSSTILDITSGLLITLGNPKPLIFYAAIMPQVIDVTLMTMTELSVVIAIVLITLLIVGGAYIWAAHRAALFFTNETMQNRLNKGSGAVLFGTATWVALQA